MNPLNDIKILGIKYDQKSSFLRGAAAGPPGVRKAFYSKSINAYSELGANVTENDRISFEKDFAPKEYFDIEDKAKHLLSSGSRLFSIGGDHSITYPLIKAYAEFYKQIEILHIDAHSDLYDEFEGDPYSHACPFARIMEEGLANRLVQVGIRCLTPHLDKQGKKFGVEVLEMKNYSLAKIPKFKNPLYISLDLDALDPAHAPGVAHHEPGGFTSRQVIDIIHAINVPIIGADLTEFNPDRDENGITAALAAKLMKEMLGKMLG